MITEDHVSFEIAKLLKEKGFNEQTNCSYIIDNTNRPMVKIGDFVYNKNNESHRIAAPTLQMAMKWLREIHDLHICIFIGEDYSTDADGNTVDKWQFWTYNITNIYGDMVYNAYDKFDCTEYQSYEEACEAAIKYCLTNLI